MCGLADLDFADLAFGHEAAQINFAEIKQRDDGGAGVTTSPGSAARVTTVPEKGALTVRSCRLACGFGELGRACWRLGVGAGDLSLLLSDLAVHDGRLAIRECLGWRDWPGRS